MRSNFIFSQIFEITSANFLVKMWLVFSENLMTLHHAEFDWKMIIGVRKIISLVKRIKLTLPYLI